MSRFLLCLALLAPGAFADSIPNALYLRHARDLIPQFLESQSRVYGVDLAVDVDSLTVPSLSGSLRLPDTLEFGVFGPNCRRIEGYLPGPHARAMFFVRTVGQRFQLARTCESLDTPPRLAVELPGERFERFDDAEFLDLARPLLARLAPDALEALEVKWPWYAEWPLGNDFQNIFDIASPQDCRLVTFGGRASRGRVGVRISYDTPDLDPAVPVEHQRIVSDPVRLRQFRVALVRGCGWFSRVRPAAVVRRPR